MASARLNNVGRHGAGGGGYSRVSGEENVVVCDAGEWKVLRGCKWANRWGSQRVVTFTHSQGGLYIRK